MSYAQMTYYSLALARSTTFNLVLPNDVADFMKQGNDNFKREMKVLYLLHGYSGYFGDWMVNSRVAEIATKYNVAVVMPSGDNSFYLDQKGTGYKYDTFIGKELPEYISRTFGLSSKPEDNFIGGLSMGGFGAIHAGLAHPETFGKFFGLSSALITNEVAKMEEGVGNPTADYDYYERTFGNPKTVLASESSPEYIVNNRLSKGEKIQPVFMACGTEDFLLEANREFKDFLLEKGVELTYKESKGVHDWNFWNEYLEPAIRWALGLE